MKIKELLETASACATTAGGMAPVALPLGEIIRRPEPTTATKYRNSAPVTDKTMKTKHARR